MQANNVEFSFGRFSYIITLNSYMTVRQAYFPFINDPTGLGKVIGIAQDHSANNPKTHSISSYYIP